ncbi:MAG: NAD(P)-binding domain-containing protein [Bacteroidia bacterium]|nr:NAD(P)-binding domain-containing protein [Bacteroidia bacterium]
MKNISIFGTGAVGRTLGTKLVQLGHRVMMGSRTKDNEKAMEWADKNGQNALYGNFEDAAEFSNIIINCTKGAITLEVFELAGINKLKNKIILDLSNPLDFSNGMPPSLYPQWSNTYSLGEAIQDKLPESKVVKSLNMVNCEVMADATLCGGSASMFICGNDDEAKKEIASILNEFGWTKIIDLGDIKGARGLESLLPIWVRLWSTTGNGHIAFDIVGL